MINHRDYRPNYIVDIINHSSGYFRTIRKFLKKSLIFIIISITIMYGK